MRFSWGTRVILLTISGWLTLQATGCVPTNYTIINPPPRAMKPRPVDTVDLMSSGPPRRLHLDVGIVEATGYWSVELVDALRKRAAEQGCDGLVIGALTVAMRADHIQGTCIVYLEDEAGSLYGQPHATDTGPTMQPAAHGPQHPAAP
jgi:hypothetical protein